MPVVNIYSVCNCLQLLPEQLYLLPSSLPKLFFAISRKEASVHHFILLVKCWKISWIEYVRENPKKCQIIQEENEYLIVEAEVVVHKNNVIRKNLVE